ncbi:MAG: ThuA domain-containing protein [Flammeovirgaceae bacterium]|nr:ThuA domain-containing protein [Flammeovirgaceae bacterium]
MMKLLLLSIILSSCSNQKQEKATTNPNIQILFLGHDSEHHNSEKYLPILASALVKKGIQFTYTSDPSDLNTTNLNKYDGLAIYANHDVISESQETALLQFVESGKGFIPIHSASYCFRNSQKFVDLVGAQFQKHGTGTFTTKITDSQHPALKNVTEFETWDETYVHHLHNDDKVVLMERSENGEKEPWTWIRQQGKGRIFYTAYGHDERTWGNPGFHQLMESGIKWAVGEEVVSEKSKMEFPNLAYKLAKIPNYEKRDPAPKLQDPLSPEASQKLTQYPQEFTLELFASEPDIINPISMAWDEKGRLWVIETVDYPNTVRDSEGEGDDRIKICEDTDGDGKADKFTIFAENLNIPTSLVFANDGVIISQAPHFLFLKDTDGDDKADVKKVIISGWGTFDTHAGPSNLKYGFDNRIWGTVGYSGFFGPVNGDSLKFGQGIYNFNLDGSDLTYLTRTSNNTWGLGFSEDFNVFGSTANNTHSVFMGIPNTYFDGFEAPPFNGSKKIDGHYGFHPITSNYRQVDVFGGFTAAAGHSLYTARNFPKEYWNRIALVCEPTGRLIHNAVLEKDGAGFKEKDGWNLIASNDEWFGPVHAEVGPDGAVWVLDWYNFIIQHNPTPKGFENGKGNAHINPLRDKKHGRIYRLSYNNSKEYEPISLSKERPMEVVKTLQNDNLFWRMTAQRLLVERGQLDVVEPLINLVKNNSVDEIGLNPGAIHALWTLHGLGVFQNEANEAYWAAVHALNHPSSGVRKAAIQVLPRTIWANQAITSSGILSDSDPNVQLTAILALVEMAPSEKTGKWLYDIADNEEIIQDEWLSKAVYCAAAKHRKGFMEAMKLDKGAIPSPIANEQHSTSNWTKSNFSDDDWKQMKLPNLWENTSIGELDGIVWFRKEIKLSNSQASGKAKLYLGPIDDEDETWINGVKVGATENDYKANRIYNISNGIFKPGKNVISIKVTDTGGGGGIWGKPDSLFIKTGIEKINLQGDWKYKIEKEFSKGSQPFFTAEKGIREVFVEKVYAQNLQNNNNDNTTESAELPVIISIKPIKNEMKYDTKTFQVEAGKMVEIHFENIDFMQHNLVIGKSGSLEIVGKAADELASATDGVEKNYVPEIPEVLFATTLVDPESTYILKFKAPEKPGEYPFVCTFPGHWRIMNGIMKIVPKTSL